MLSSMMRVLAGIAMGEDQDSDPETFTIHDTNIKHNIEFNSKRPWVSPHNLVLQIPGELGLGIAMRFAIELTQLEDDVVEITIHKISSRSLWMWSVEDDPVMQELNRERFYELVGYHESTDEQRYSIWNLYNALMYLLDEYCKSYFRYTQGAMRNTAAERTCYEQATH